MTSAYRLFSALFLVCWLLGGSAEAQSAHRIRIIGRKTATVTTAQVLLGNVADVSAASPADDDAVIALKKLQLTASPAPGSTATLSASELVEKLRAAGVSFNDVGYMFPRVVTIERAGRPISLEEVRAAIEAHLSRSGRDAVLRDVEYRKEVFVAPGDMTLKVVDGGSEYSGRSGITLAAGVNEEEPVRFRVNARLEEFRQVPVARRPVARGKVVTEDDLMMARLNIAMLPNDVALEPKDIIGLETNNDISYGEAFHNRKLVQRPVVAAGARVTLIYKAPLFEATASGIALESGGQGQEIKVRNVSSKRVVNGKVLEPGLVKVGP